MARTKTSLPFLHLRLHWLTREECMQRLQPANATCVTNGPATRRQSLPNLFSLKSVLKAQQTNLDLLRILNIQITPTSQLNHTDYNKIGWYWYEGYKGIKYANVVIDRIDDAVYKDEAERNAVLGSAYFHRAFRYYRLTQQFGNIPFYRT
jgi:hypothetical protein